MFVSFSPHFFSLSLFLSGELSRECHRDAPASRCLSFSFSLFLHFFLTPVYRHLFLGLSFPVSRARASRARPRTYNGSCRKPTYLKYEGGCVILCRCRRIYRDVVRSKIDRKSWNINSLLFKLLTDFGKDLFQQCQKAIFLLSKEYKMFFAGVFAFNCENDVSAFRNISRCFADTIIFNNNL